MSNEFVYIVENAECEIQNVHLDLEDAKRACREYSNDYIHESDSFVGIYETKELE